MSIRVICPSGHPLKLADSMAGRVGPCPICRKPVHVPASGAKLVDAHGIGVGAKQDKQASEKPPADTSLLPPPALDVGPAPPATVTDAETHRRPFVEPLTAIMSGEDTRPPSAPPAPKQVEPVRTRTKLADTAPMIPASAEERDELEWAADLAWAEPVASPPFPTVSPEKPLPAATIPAASPGTEFPGRRPRWMGRGKFLAMPSRSKWRLCAGRRCIRCPGPTLGKSSGRFTDSFATPLRNGTFQISSGPRRGGKPAREKRRFLRGSNAWSNRCAA